MEERRDIPGYGGYRISNFGIVTFNGIIMQGCIAKGKKKILNKYCSVYIAGKSKKVHCLVMLTFIGEKPERYVIDHINEKKYDNRLENLEYVTSSENTMRACALSRNNKGEDTILASKLGYKL